MRRHNKASRMFENEAGLTSKKYHMEVSCFCYSSEVEALYFTAAYID